MGDTHSSKWRLPIWPPAPHRLFSCLDQKLADSTRIWTIHAVRVGCPTDLAVKDERYKWVVEYHKIAVCQYAALGHLLLRPLLFVLNEFLFCSLYWHIHNHNVPVCLGCRFSSHRERHESESPRQDIEDRFHTSVQSWDEVSTFMSLTALCRNVKRRFLLC